MANTMQFDLVSPERRVASLAASEVMISGSEGDMTVMPGHAALITTLRPGVLKAVSGKATVEYVVTGGFAEITAESASVLAERALPAAECTQEIFDEMCREAREAHKKAGPNEIDSAVKLLGDMVAMGSHMGLDISKAWLGA